MRFIEVIVLVAGATSGWCAAWWWTTRTLYLRSLHSVIRPSHVSEQEYENGIVARRKLWRLAKAALGAAVGVAIAWMAYRMLLSGFQGMNDGGTGGR